MSSEPWIETPENRTDEPPTEAPGDRPVPRQRHPSIGPGRGALAGALALLLLQIVAIVVGGSGAWVAATVLAWLVIVLTVGTFGVALVAVIRGRQRRFAIAAMIVSLVANPLVLVGLFAALGSH